MSSNKEVSVRVTPDQVKQFFKEKFIDESGGEKKILISGSSIKYGAPAVDMSASAQ